MKFQIQISGAKEISKSISQLSAGAQKNILRTVPTAGAAIVRKAVRSAAPKGETGNLRRGIKTRRRREWEGRNKRRAISILYVDYRIASHFHLVEDGTTKRYRKLKNGRRSRPGQRKGRGGYTGKVRGTHFAERAIKRTRVRAVKAMYGASVKGLRKEMTKAFTRATGYRPTRKRR